MAEKRVGDNDIRGAPNGASGALPFTRSPTTDHATHLLAEWDRPPDATRLDHHELYDAVMAVPGDPPHAIQWDLTLVTCKCCNDAMTMEFWCSRPRPCMADPASLHG